MATLGAITLGALLTDNARRDPDRIAIVCDGRRVTYRELDLLSNSLANTLIERGIAPGDRAAVYLPNGIELVVALCGVLKAGAIVVPVSTRLAPAEVEIMLDDSQPAAVIFHAGARAAVQGLRQSSLIRCWSATVAQWPPANSISNPLSRRDRHRRSSAVRPAPMML